MKKYLNLLKTTRLFEGVEEERLLSLLECLRARTVSLGDEQPAIAAGERPDRVGIVLEGRVHIVREDSDGNRVLLASLDPGEMFGEALAGAGVSESPVSAVAVGGTEVLLFPFYRTVERCENGCEFHTRLIHNMLGIISRKNLGLQHRIEIISKKSIRERVMTFLREQSADSGADEFEIPFNREQLADYLCTDRSALSRELGRLAKYGEISFRKNKFKLL